VLRRWLIVAALIVAATAGWVVWRFTASIEVRLAGDPTDLPFEIETIPSVVQARPGELVKVIYRIRNTDLSPLVAYGQIEIDPDTARDQIQIFLTQCGGINTFENNYPQDYEVIFRVQPAGLTGVQQMTLWHIFTRATPGS